jgi:hypothetical protein
MFVALLAGLTLWSGWLVFQSHRQHEFGRAIVAAGGIVEYNVYDDRSGKWDTNAPIFVASWLRRISGSDRFDVPTIVRFFGANHPEAHPDFARLLGPLSQVRSISLYGHRIGRADLEWLAQKSSLRALMLGEIPLEDDDLEVIQGLQLRWLSLHRTRVSDHGLAHVRRMQSLEYLDLTRTRVGDPGLEHLAALPNLRRLIVRRCKVTRSGAARLQAQLPKCKIDWEPLNRRP